MENIIPIRFFIVTFLWSWLFMAILYIICRKKSVSENNFNFDKISFPFMVIGAFGPAVGAAFSLYTINGKEAVTHFFASFLSLNFGWVAWLSIFLVLGGSAFLSWLIPGILGKKLTFNFHNLYKFPVILVVLTFLGGGQEEIGWRGYILPFFENGYGLLIGSLILGIIWSIWHLPLWFMPGSDQKQLNFFAFTMQCIGLSYFFSWIIDISGNRLLSGVIAHGAFNALLFIFPWFTENNKLNKIRIWINSFLILIIGIIIVLIRMYS